MRCEGPRAVVQLLSKACDDGRLHWKMSSTCPKPFLGDDPTQRRREHPAPLPTPIQSLPIPAAPPFPQPHPHPHIYPPSPPSIFCARSSTSPSIAASQTPTADLATTVVGRFGAGTAAWGPSGSLPPIGGKVRCGLWNVRGFISNEHCRLRERIISASGLDFICLCETFLRGSDGLNIPGYRWFGHNRLNISRRAVRGSGGVGILFKDSFFEEYSVDIVGKTHEDIMWISCTHFTNLEHTLFICTCYLPPAASSRGGQIP